MEQAKNRVDETTDGPQVLGGKTSSAWKAHWQRELEAESKRNREWRKAADKIVKRFIDKRKDQGPQYNAGNAEFRVNLFHSNIFTLTSFLYGRVPEVDVSRRFADSNDDVARVAANILERMLNTSIETDGGSFSAIMRANLEDHLVPGLGIARVRYEMATKEQEVPEQTDPWTGEVIQEATTKEVLDWEDAPVDYVHWRDFHWGYARMWQDVPWVGYDLYLTPQEAEDRFGKETASQFTYKKQDLEAEDENIENTDMRDPDKTAKVTEIWSKTHSLVFWYHEDLEMMADTQEDPLGLPGFYSCPRPMVANSTTTLFLPTPYFMLAMDLYNEVDQLSTRINIITNAVKVVGVFDKGTPELKTMFQGSIENDLIGVDKWAMLAEKGGLKGVIDFYPIKDVVDTLDKLREMRREAIELLYQVTGLSDIMRGGGEKYEGVGKAQLKAKFASVRVQYLQEEFGRYGSDLLTLKAQVISRHFSPQTIFEQSNIGQSYDKEHAPQAVQLIKDLSASVWRVQVKPETMAMIDWAQLKQDRTEFINALALFMQSAAPLLEQNPSAAPFLLELLKWGLAGFKGGQEIESVIDKAIQQYSQQLSQQQGQQGGEGDKEAAKSKIKLVENKQKFDQDMAKQADKANKELKKLVVQFKLDLEKIKAETRAEAIGEVVQANQNIREQQAKVKTETKAG